MGKRILLVSDQPSYGKVALAAQVPVLSSMKHELFCLPTALVSNTLDYSKFIISETTDYMKQTLAVWEDLGFGFDAVCTGFMVTQEQTQLVIDLCKKASVQGQPVFCDPIMGDDGHLYNGIGPETVELMRQLISHADYIVPNYTEAAVIADLPYYGEGMTDEQARQLIDNLRARGAKSVVVTSAILADPERRNSVIGYSHTEDEYFTVPFDQIPWRFPGTGDIFSAVFTGKVLCGFTVRQATKIAMDAVRNMIAESGASPQGYTGLPVEAYLGLIPESAE